MIYSHHSLISLPPVSDGLFTTRSTSTYMRGIESQRYVFVASKVVVIFDMHVYILVVVEH